MADPVYNTVIPNEDDYLDDSTESNSTDYIANFKPNGSTTMHPDAIQTVTSSFGVTMAFVGMAIGCLVVGILAAGIIYGIIHWRKRRSYWTSRDEEGAQPEPEDKLMNTHDSNHNQDSNGADCSQSTRMLTDIIPTSLHETSL